MRKVETTSRRFTLALSLCVLAACGGDAAQGAGARSEAPESRPPSPIEIVDFDGLEAALDARRGTGMLLNFWAMWCAPCVAEMPDLVEVSRAYRERGGQVVGISYDLMVAGADADTIETTLRTFLDSRKLDLAVLVYDEADYESINQRFALPGEVPVTLALDAEGKIVDRQHGKAGKERFEEMMRKALGL